MTDIKGLGKLENYLPNDKTPGIDLDDWLSNPTKQGLPKSKTKEGKLYYWSPEDGRAAGFYVNSGSANLNCGWDPDGRSSALGVRACAEGAAKKI